MGDNKSVDYFGSRCKALFKSISEILEMEKTVAVYMEELNESNNVNTIEENVKMYIDTQHKLLHYAKTLAEINQLLNLDDFSDSEVNHEDYLAIFDDKVSTLPKLNLNKHYTYKEFKKAVWNVHHPNEPMAGEEGEELIVMTTDKQILKCPLTTADLVDPYRSKKCGHVFNREAIFQYIDVSDNSVRCPVVGCNKIITRKDIEKDTELEKKIKKRKREDDQNDVINT